MGNRRERKKRREETLKQAILYEIYGLVLLAVSILALVQTGYVGKIFRGIFRFFAGSWDFLIPLLMIGISFYVIWKREWPRRWGYRWNGLLLICLSLMLLSHYSLVEALTANGRFADQSVLKITWNLIKEDFVAEAPLVDLGGGMIGALIYTLLTFLIDAKGILLIVPFMFLIGFLLITGKSYKEILLKGKQQLNKLFGWLKVSRQQLTKVTQEENQAGHASRKELVEPPVNQSDNQTDEVIYVPESHHPNESVEPEIYDFTEVAYKEKNDQPAGEQKAPAERNQVIAYIDNEADNYQLPPFSLLKETDRSNAKGKQDIATNARKLERTLESFGVSAKVTQVHRGPAVTRYEVYPDVGVKVSRIVSLTDDIALALAAKGIRIEAPIPGKSAIGIEVPNDDIAIVTLREVLESPAFLESPSKLSIALGRDISGEPIIAHLNKMPHLLVAGSTGSGKSVCINGIIISILYKAKPHEVKLMMIDPKMVELNVYNGIPHLLAPVVTDPKKASIALKKVVAEMERRYELFAQSGTRDLERYNELIREENRRNPEAQKPLLPYIVVIIDELADLMMVAPGDVEEAICRLAQMARAAGIHLIIATQRPSVDVITGLIKANIPSRIAFAVSSQVDSRTILDMSGAEKLLGRGDMLFLPVGANKALRIQGAFVADDEVEKVVQFCISQQKASYHEEMLPNETEENMLDEVEDELYDEAVAFVRQQGTASVSMLQRRFRIGYNRAARLIDYMEERGVVGPYEGSRPREVLLPKEESHTS